MKVLWLACVFLLFLLSTEEFDYNKEERYECKGGEMFGNQRRFPGPIFWDYKINLLGEKDDTPVHFCDKCGLPIKMYGRMVSEITSGRCSHGSPLGKIRFYCVCLRLLEVTDFNRRLNKQQNSTRMELEAFTAQVFLFLLSG